MREINANTSGRTIAPPVGREAPLHFGNQPPKTGSDCVERFASSKHTVRADHDNGNIINNLNGWRILCVVANLGICPFRGPHYGGMK
jgi:hypothetical protein